MTAHDGSGAVIVATFPMPPGVRFDRHTHEQHQLAWAPTGVLVVATEEATWVLPPTRALWLPAAVTHEVRSSGRATMKAVYLDPEHCPINWAEPTPVAMRRLLAALIDHLDTETLPQERRQRAEAVLVDLLEPVATAPIALPMPTDPRAREVAEALARDPADSRSLDGWGRHVGASGRTLARTFLADTGLPFGRWRTLLRLQSALPHLAADEPVATVARRVGYDTPSAFVAAFRRETGLTPGAYFNASPF